MNYRSEKIYLDVWVTWNKEKYIKAKVKHYQGYEVKIIPIIVGKNCTLHKESHLFLKELKVNMQTFYAEIGLYRLPQIVTQSQDIQLIGYKISRYAQMCNNSLYKKRNLEKEINLEEAPIGKLDMNKFAPLADLGEDNDKREKEPIKKLLIQQNKWNNSHASQSDIYTFTSQIGENRRRKSNHQKANTLTRQIDRQNKFAQLRVLQLKQWKLRTLLRAQEGIKSFNKFLNGNQKPIGNSFTGQQNQNSSIKQ
ncbi:Hypothetical_protein [Hexamita inflata]|uniref:Hypothetical_protein n=1 Tax=Hexamita inflata TaxID=28002 RepID=A0ABP1GWZ2_9EUKA